MKKPIPKHIVEQYGSTREFKATKRAELRSMLRALDDFRLGCAFVPDGPGIVRHVTELLTGLQDRISVKEWK